MSLLARKGALIRSSATVPSPHTKVRSRKIAAPAMIETPGKQDKKIIQLQSQLITAEAFEPFGQVVGPTDDGKQFDQEDAQLILDKGTPRFYIMRLPRRGLKFSRITYHANVTQCLGGLSPVAPWYIVVAAPSGSVEAYPTDQQLTAFKVPHGVFVKFKEGTWHAGPLFDNAEHMDFYNLELSDTNVVDHNTHDYGSSNDVAYQVLEC